MKDLLLVLCGAERENALLCVLAPRLPSTSVTCLRVQGDER